MKRPPDHPSLFDMLEEQPAPEPKPALNREQLFLEQIKRDSETLRDPLYRQDLDAWWIAFYEGRIREYRAALLELKSEPPAPVS